MADWLRLFSDYTFRVVATGAALMGAIAGVMGCFAVLGKQSLLGDGISHAALPGVVLAFLATGTRASEVLLLGALLAGLLASTAIHAIVARSRIKFDGALALVMSGFFGLGLVLLTVAQKRPDANQAGLGRFLFGQASALLADDLRVLALVGAALIPVVVLLWKEWKVVLFDRTYALCIGLPVRALERVLSWMIVAGIVVGLQTVGVVLMSAMLVAPAVAARQWTNNLRTMVFLAAALGALSGVAGTIASACAPKLPTGPAIVVAVSVCVGLSILFAPARGLCMRRMRPRSRRKEETHVHIA